MAQANLELATAAIANNIIQTVQSLGELGEAIGRISSSWTNLSAANKLNNFPTAAATTTGGIGTPDGSPNVANPIDITVAPGNEITVAISANNIASMLTFIQGIQSAIDGSAVNANGAAPQLVAMALGSH